MLHKCLSAFCPPLFSVPLVISPLAFLPFLRSSCGYLFCPFSYGVFSFSTSSFGGFGLLHSPAYSSPSACSLGVPGTSVLPSSGVSMGWGFVYVEFCTGIASGSYRCFFSLHCLATSVCASSCGSFFLSSCFPASGCLRVLSPVFSLAFLFLDVAWLGLSSAGFSVSLLPAVLCLALHYCLLPLFALLLLAPLRVSKALPLRCLGLLGLFVSMQFAPGRSRVFSGFFSYSFFFFFFFFFCTALLASAAGLFGFASPLSRPC